MKKIHLIIITILVSVGMTGCVNTGVVKPLARVKDVSHESVSRQMDSRPKFYTGKRLTYLMAWNKIPVGRVIAESGDIIDYRGRKVYVVTIVTESNKFLSSIYRVEDKYTSYIDVETMTSRRYEANRREGNYRKHVIVEYDFDKKEATYTNLTDGSVKKCPIADNVQDPVSTICTFMTMPVKIGEEVRMTVNLNEKNYELVGKVEQLDVVKLPGWGSIPAFKVSPYAVLGGERVKKGSAWMYFAADERRYPLYGAVLIPFGKVTSTLRTVEDI